MEEINTLYKYIISSVLRITDDIEQIKNYIINTYNDIPNKLESDIPFVFDTSDLSLAKIATTLPRTSLVRFKILLNLHKGIVITNRLSLPLIFINMFVFLYLGQAIHYPLKIQLFGYALIICLIIVYNLTRLIQKNYKKVLSKIIKNGDYVWFVSTNVFYYQNEGTDKSTFELYGKRTVVVQKNVSYELIEDKVNAFRLDTQYSVQELYVFLLCFDYFKKNGKNSKYISQSLISIVSSLIVFNEKTAFLDFYLGLLNIENNDFEMGCFHFNQSCMVEPLNAIYISYKRATEFYINKKMLTTAST